MTDRKDLLIEIGTEELPPGALLRLAEAFADGLRRGLDDAGLACDNIRHHATPRRLAVTIEQLATRQPDKTTTKRGPAVAAAFDENGNPTRAAEGFAASCGVTVADLDRIKTDKGEWLGIELHEPGKATETLIPGLTQEVLGRLPIPKRMRWGNSTVEFVRPVHWAVALFGEGIIPFEIFGRQTGRVTYGHRFHHPAAIELRNPAEYRDRLKNEGYVLADFNERRETIRRQVLDTAKALRGTAVVNDHLLDEVTGLTEWPVPVTGGFAARFLDLPPEVLIATMQDKQNYFPVQNDSGDLQNHFIAIANIESKDPATVRAGNERVIVPRLSDAEFFWQRDTQQPLAAYQPLLATIIYQKQLGTLADKADRIGRLAQTLATELGYDAAKAERAAALCKCDLVTDMVGEFPELQGTMGRYYAIESGEDDEIARALAEHYAPRFAGDHLPETQTGTVLALADKLDTLAGIFGIGQQPGSDKDPFALRRAALGVVRVLVEKALPLSLKDCVKQAFASYDDLAEAHTDLITFIFDRARGYFADQGYTATEIEAVFCMQPIRIDIVPVQLEAVRNYNNLPEAPNLSAANKRIGNILKNLDTVPDAYKQELLVEEAEIQLAEQYRQLAPEIDKLFENQQYSAMLQKLAVLKEPVDTFFDTVMVMTDDQNLRDNRIGLLKELHLLMNRIADLSRLAA